MKLWIKKHKKLFAFLISLIVILSVGIAFVLIIYNKAYHKCYIECGSTVEASEFIKDGNSDAYFIDENLNISELKPGQYDISVKSGLFTYKVNVIIQDTIVPEADSKDVYITVGDSVSANCFVDNIVDATDVSVSFASMPDFNSVNNSTVSIVLKDEAGNMRNVVSNLDVVPFYTKLEIEAGSKNLSAADFKAASEDYSVISDLTAISMNSVSDNFVTISFNNKEYISVVSVVDTKMPEVKFKNIDGFIGMDYKAEDFVDYAKDETNLSYSFESEFDNFKSEKQDVVIKVVDEGGNEVVGNVTASLKTDDEPPILEGVKDIYVYQGNSVSYKDGITVSDNCVEGIDFKVDAKAVNTDEVGTYPVTYIVSDVGGHVVTASCNVIVMEREYNMDEINAKADEILSQIIEPGMTERDKAWAIYSYIRGHMYFIDDYDEGSYEKACYDGVIGWKGDCYVYACTAQTLLTRANIKSIIVSKIPTRRHHYWNIVNCDGEGWYHYDTTPRAEENHPVFFMWTDAQMMDYSSRHYNCFNYDKSLYPEVN